MDEPRCYEYLTQIFRELFDDEDIQVTPDLTANKVHGWDSFKHIELLAAVQQKFDVRFSAREIEKLSHVGDIVDLILQKRE